MSLYNSVPNQKTIRIGWEFSFKYFGLETVYNHSMLSKILLVALLIFAINTQGAYDALRKLFASMSGQLITNLEQDGVGGQQYPIQEAPEGFYACGAAIRA